MLFSVAALLTTCSSPGAAPATNSSLLAPNRFAGSQRQAKGVVGSLYISSQLKHAVAVYGGNPLDYAGSIKKGLSLPNAIAFNSNKELFVADQGTNAVSVYAASTGKLIRTLSTRFTKTPTQVAVAPNGDVYVRSRNYVNIFIKGQLSGSKKINERPSTISIDSSGNAYLATNDSIDVFAPEGTKPTRSIKEGVDRPLAMGFDTNGNLYVSNAPSSSCGNITVYNAASGVLESTITQNVCGPRSIAFDSQNNVYVGNSKPMSVNVFSETTQKWLKTITNGITLPGPMVFDPSGDLYVLNIFESGNPGNVVVFPAGSNNPGQTLTHGIEFPVDLAWLP